VEARNCNTGEAGVIRPGDNWFGWLIGLGCFVLVAAEASGQNDLRLGNMSITAPTGWRRRGAEALGPTSLLVTSFSGPYERGGILPPDGAEIEIVQEAAPVMGLGTYLGEDIKEAEVISQEELVIGGHAGMRVEYRDTFGPALVYRNIGYYLLVDGVLWKFYLSARDGAANWSSHVQTIDRLVTDVRFTR
jgi:hypothetical protein